MKRRGFLLLLALIITTVTLTAQSPLEPIPQDAAVRVGVLENGLSYYIRANSYPKGQADFYIYSDVGAVQEADDQQGLAHFMEHMAFNGTKNLPGKELIDYLESIGVKFGANLNAYTSLDETVYMMKDVPVTREGVIDTALLILHDWAYYIDPQGEEIDKERGVIKEELRTRDGASWRSSMELFKALGRGTVYERRNIIGYLDFLENFPHEALTKFYHDWYRPDYQAFIIVGDIDVDHVEQKIIALCSDIPAAAADAPKKQVVIVPDNEEPIISIFSDAEMTRSSVTFIAKGRATPLEERNSYKQARTDILERYITIMENHRLTELTYIENTPLQYASFGIGSLGIIPTLEAEIVQTLTKEGRIVEAFELIYTELERMRRHGFNHSEWERAKREMLSSAKRSYDGRDDRRNGDYIYSYIAAYSENAAIPDPTTRYQIDSTFISEITLEEINQRVKSFNFEDNIVIAVNSPLKEGLTLPCEEEFTEVMAAIISSEIEPIEDKEELPPLISQEAILEGGAVVSERAVEELDAVEWTLENGIKVVVKPTTFKQNEVIFNASCFGGATLLDEDDYLTGRQFFNSFITDMGLGDLSRLELQRALSGKNAWTSLGLYTLSSQISGASTPEDIETLMQLIFLRFTSPRFDETDFNNTRAKLRESLTNRFSNPDMQAQREYNRVLYDNHPYRETISTQTLDAVRFEQLEPIFNTIFTDADSYLFTFVGNIDLESFKPLVERYIGSLPTSEVELTWRDDGVRKVEGGVSYEFTTAMEQPKVSVLYNIGTQMERTAKRDMTMQFLTDALNNLYLETVREEKGGSYGVGVWSDTWRRPVEHYSIAISFDTNAEMADELMQTVMEGLEQIATDGPSSEQIAKTREFQIKSYTNNLEENSYWSYLISELYNEDEDMLHLTPTLINAVTSEDIAHLARQILESGNIVKVVMRPE